VRRNGTFRSGAETPGVGITIQRDAVRGSAITLTMLSTETVKKDHVVVGNGGLEIGRWTVTSFEPEVRVMSRLGNMRTRNILAIGALVVVAGMLVVPGSALGKALKFMGIEGTSGNRADVSAANQLLTTTANPADFYQPGFQFLPSGSTVSFPAPTDSALVITSLRIDAYYDPSPGGGSDVFFEVETGTSCAGSMVGTYDEIVNPGGIGVTVIPLDPGVGIPEGDALCAQAGAGGMDSEVNLSGYTVPSSSVTAGTLHPAVLPSQP